jgi:hypothetical protein
MLTGTRRTDVPDSARAVSPQPRLDTIDVVNMPKRSVPGAIDRAPTLSEEDSLAGDSHDLVSWREIILAYRTIFILALLCRH